MKVLLDECVPQDFRHAITGYDVYTVAFMPWNGVKNGRLLELAEAEGFSARITTDRNIAHQQNPALLPVAIVVLEVTSNDLEDLQAAVPALLQELRSLTPRTVVHVRP